ncbi:MAG: 50S ribosomal protein L21 [Cyanothece sp. SIO1E1]|nr:50S ribosomal protein L21 [Cyanothece sp. SIO1E1]
MTYAIIETGGKQLRVEPGRFYDVELLPFEENAHVTLDQVLFVEHEGDVTVGQPLVDGATVSATVMSHLRGRKIIVYKMRPKKKTRKKQGHRQELTRLMIDAINMGGSIIAGESSSVSTVNAIDTSESEGEAEPMGGEFEAEAAVATLESEGEDEELQAEVEAASDDDADA